MTSQYRGWTIEPNLAASGVPASAGVDWIASHEQYDGPEDNRCFAAASVEDCKIEIDEREGLDDVCGLMHVLLGDRWFDHRWEES